MTRAIAGPAAAWDVNAHLLASIVDLLNGANWQRGGGKGQRPKPVKRPGAKKAEKRLGADAIPIHDFDDWWGQAAPEPAPSKALAVYDPYLARLGAR